MPYHIYVPTFKDFLSTIIGPAVLEIGIDHGVTFIPLAVHMKTTHDRYALFGVDIDVKTHVFETLKNIGVGENVVLVNGNSIEVLPNFVKSGFKFDLILIDGDHNYHTVRHELECVDKLLGDVGLVVVDDYDGKWSNRDLWYSEKDDYKENVIATRPVSTDKVGVNSAVDEFVSTNEGWVTSRSLGGESILLMRSTNESEFLRNLFGLDGREEK